MRKRRMQSKRLTKTVAANRRKRKLVNNKKKVIARHRAFMQLSSY
ncbi:hypothetical protein RJD38_02720 [Vibrio scophthalmi]|uniref:Uncharacterized protein n=2 Tax=Vibrio scophthalmi TaxID=45658 RepID=A0A1B1NQX9_9VIBR|nr:MULTISPECIES: hypothetical protein [Vibrio]ANS86162.1 hypothetical protein VSVS12_02402 [Vibrio scophthalmi]ANU35706.1 hypothetical protein VSVS05_00573 [Vibrio scophthalmi]EGU40767.1 hypothetical protein VIS19158_02420 [Vibrio scophthalmi LMG 19158]MCY9805790.1 hypothetical protein [Vibrio scophthalmi]ODS10638.1 hypothetical protein VSF3289_00897 [Vibrio scophthalmi]